MWVMGDGSQSQGRVARLSAWRYMDLARFITIVDKRALFFPNLSTLSRLDPYEGSIPKFVEESRFADLDEKEQRVVRQNRQQRALEYLDNALVSCWHLNAGESEAMWALYAQRGYGVAIRTRASDLRQAFPNADELSCGKVRYVDYDLGPSEGSIDDRFGNPVMLKRSAFSHEREYRVTTRRSNPRHEERGRVTADRPMADLDGPRAADENPPYHGEYVSVDLTRLVHEVVVAPDAPSWHHDVLVSVVEAFELDLPVVPSKLRGGTPLR